MEFGQRPHSAYLYLARSAFRRKSLTLDWVSNLTLATRIAMQYSIRGVADVCLKHDLKLKAFDTCSNNLA
jgi:hypothetical protein